MPFNTTYLGMITTTLISQLKFKSKIPDEFKLTIDVSRQPGIKNAKISFWFFVYFQSGTPRGIIHILNN